MARIILFDIWFSSKKEIRVNLGNPWLTFLSFLRLLVAK
jgi:hypothetical protein